MRKGEREGGRKGWKARGKKTRGVVRFRGKPREEGTDSLSSP